jgi:hypothetical protein
VDAQRARRTRRRQDRWNVVFFRLVQVIGLGLIVYEAVLTRGGRWPLLLVYLAMITGPEGVWWVLRGWRRLQDGGADDDPR